jgi:hypothetical protein
MNNIPAPGNGPVQPTGQAFTQANLNLQQAIFANAITSQNPQQTSFGQFQTSQMGFIPGYVQPNNPLAPPRAQSIIIPPYRPPQQ